jgi:hypothetical protein
MALLRYLYTDQIVPNLNEQERQHLTDLAALLHVPLSPAVDSTFSNLRSYLESMVMSKTERQVTIILFLSFVFYSISLTLS